MPGLKTTVTQPVLNLFGFEESYIHRINFNVQQRGRLIVVRYDPTAPDEVAILDCPVTTQYEYLASDGKHQETMKVQTLAELSASVPLGVARFGGYVKAGSQLEFVYATVGSYQVTVDPKITSTDPECATATHYVASLSVGAFEFTEWKKAQAGVSAEARGVGVHADGSRERGVSRSWGSLAACDLADHKGCRTPTQMLLLPLHEGVGHVDELPAMPTTVTATPVAPPAIELRVDESRWRPGHHMATALEKTLAFAQYIEDSTKFGFDGDATAILAGVLTDQGLRVDRPLRAGRQYVVFAAASHDVDIDLGIFDAAGEKVAVDNEKDSQPIVSFTPPADGTYRILIAPGGEDVATFVGVGILNDVDGYRAPPAMLRSFYQGLLDSGAQANDSVAKMEGRNGVVFQSGNGEWALLGTFMKPNESITMPGFHLAGSTIVISKAHDKSLDIDAELTDEAGRSWSDKEKDAEPVIIVDEPTAGASHALKVSYVGGQGDTVAGSLILLAQ